MVGVQTVVVADMSNRRCFSPPRAGLSIERRSWSDRLSSVKAAFEMASKRIDDGDKLVLKVMFRDSLRRKLVQRYMHIASYG